MLRAEVRAGAVMSASIAPEQRPALDWVAQFTATLKQGERGGAGLARREAERERQGQRWGYGCRAMPAQVRCVPPGLSVAPFGHQAVRHGTLPLALLPHSAGI